MTTLRRVIRDRRRYTALRRVDRWLASQLRAIGAPRLETIPHYPPPVAVHVFRWRCACCGLRRQALRFMVS